EIFKSIFPPDTEIVTAIEIVGKVGHINLRDHLLPYKHLIGEVLLDKNPSLTTIINKTSPIETEFRTFNYEILVTRVPEVHTSTSLVTEIHQSQIHFQLDVAKVYWNSRLHTEHDRLIHQIPPCSIVADVMCGVGPFSLPLAKHRDCIVVANDLNPSCIQYLQTNIKANHLSNWVVPSQLDASEFIQRISFELLQQHHQVCMDTPWSALKKKKEQTRFKQLLNVLNTMPVLHFQHYIMNLPASALQFLGAFRGLYASYPQHQHTYLKAHLPWIHVYCFVSSYMDDVSQHDFHAEIENLLHCPVPTLQVHPVRTVAPKKIMCCITFQLPSEVAFSLETSCM
ncbi:tRNA(m(1)G37)methyltransferase, partial [Coelomomyces lativittatus]